MGMTPAPDLDDALRAAKVKLGRNFATHVVPAGGYLRLYV
jgi:hypothetical protein